MTARFKLDENLPRDAEAFLRKAGHGIWILRPHTQSIDDTLSLLKGAAAVLETEPAAGRLWIVEPGRVRIHE